MSVLVHLQHTPQTSFRKLLINGNQTISFVIFYQNLISEDDDGGRLKKAAVGGGLAYLRVETEVRRPRRRRASGLNTAAADGSLFGAAS